MTQQPRRRGKYAERERHDGVELGADWRKQTVTVLGRYFRLGEVQGGTLYHGTRANLPVGSILEPGHGRNFVQSQTDAVSFTSDLTVAAQWAQKYGAGTYYVYEIEPEGEVDAWRAGLADQGRSFTLREGRAARARVVAAHRFDGPPTSEEKETL